MSIDFYVIDIDSYRFIERFSDIDFYRLPMSGTSATSRATRATVSPYVHHLQHCVQFRDAMLPAMMHRVRARGLRSRGI